MIIEKTCKCGTVIRANGNYKFVDEVKKHFLHRHSEDLINAEKLAKDANEGFKELKEKYPELNFSFGYFNIDYEKILEEKS